MHVSKRNDFEYVINLEKDEKALMLLFIVGMNEDKVQTIEDLIALLCCYACEHCTNELVVPDIKLLPEDEKAKYFSDLLTGKTDNAIYKN